MVFDLPEPDPLSSDERRYLEACKTGDIALIERLEATVNAESDERERRLTAEGVLVRTAQWYAEAGVPIFPIKPGQKEPLTKHGFLDATLDLSTVAVWWARWPNANIGAPTGIRFDVIDVDGLVGLRTWMDSDLHVDTIGHAITPRGGGHHLYVNAQENRGNKAKIGRKIGLAGLDYRGKGGYVLLPPSYLNEHRRRYRWLKALELGDR